MMKAVGELLSEAREKKGWDLVRVAETTKIQKKYLRAIEKSDFASLPPGAAVKGFIRNYALAVDVDVKTVMAMYRRDFVENEQGKIIPRGLAQPIKRGFQFSPKLSLGVALVVFTLAIGAFFARQIYLFYSGPELEVSLPVEGARVTSPVRVEGKTSSDAVLVVNNKEIGVDSEGIFGVEVALSQGEHTIVITAKDRQERQSTLQRFVLVTE